MIEINLLPTQNVLSGRAKAIRRGFFWVLGVSSLVVLLDLGGFFLVRGLVSSQVQALSGQRDGLTASSDQFLAVASDLRLVEAKVAGVTTIKSQRFDMAAEIAELQRFFTAGIELVNLEVDSLGTVSFSAKARDVESLGRFITQIGQEGKNSRWGKIILGGLHQDQGQGFSFQILAVYQPQGGSK